MGEDNFWDNLPDMRLDHLNEKDKPYWFEQNGPYGLIFKEEVPEHEKNLDEGVMPDERTVAYLELDNGDVKFKPATNNMGKGYERSFNFDHITFIQRGMNYLHKYNAQIIEPRKRQRTNQLEGSGSE